jgi:hypothetical protein
MSYIALEGSLSLECLSCSISWPSSRTLLLWVHLGGPILQEALWLNAALGTCLGLCQD